MTRNLVDMAVELAAARDTFERIQAGTFPGAPVYRAAPGCTRNCPQCDIACAITVGRIYDLEREIEAASAARFGPRAFIITEAGHA